VINTLSNKEIQIMKTATRKIVSKEIQQDADVYVGSYGEVWFQEGSSLLRFGNTVTPGRVYKDPITDPGKTSKRGVLSLVRSNGIGSSRWSTIRRSELPYGARDQLRTVFSNGELLVDETLDQIRARSLQL
jgi:hypothetical protein